MISRAIEAHVKECFSVYPVVTITGPRQSGKTTLAKRCFPDLSYVNLEHPETRLFAAEDPVAFMKKYKAGAIFDEIQNVPELTSYIQVAVDEKKQNGLFVLTGSRQFSLMERVAQSLAGRTAVVTLLPFSMSEIEGHYPAFRTATDDLIFRGFYPRLYDQAIPPSMGLSDYIATYIEKDLRQLSQIQNLGLFQKFMKLCAGRTGQIINSSGLAEDTGINYKTAQEWISLLESSYILFRLPPYFSNISKRLIKSPKLYFHDTGLAANLLGIEEVQQIETHPLRGALFENLVISEVMKHRLNQGKRPNLSFFRDAKGHEVDLLVHQANEMIPVEIKSAATVRNDFFKGINYFNKHIHPCGRSILVYDGDHNEERSAAVITNATHVTNWL
jgi:predicted AAA+ superfamily ATPase